jgi:nitroimidazol reductase NimA-like FMN-containing flavoprotein (pyridoxamine 5'-phosphate oxidase superfamily)
MWWPQVYSQNDCWDASRPRTETMLIHELNAAECLDILKGSHLGRLGCARYDQPYIVPIHFSFDPEGHCLYAFSALGQKIDWMRENPKVCLEVEDIADKNHWTTVVVIGRYEEIDLTPESADTRVRAQLLLQQRREWWFPAAGNVPSRQHSGVVLYRIHIDRVTGRRTARD